MGQTSPNVVLFHLSVIGYHGRTVRNNDSATCVNGVENRACRLWPLAIFLMSPQQQRHPLGTGA